tara:strand:+ start:2072 stop:2317 length:246 start_codon:yes stop_codon:yes gene_type:complete
MAKAQKPKKGVPPGDAFPSLKETRQPSADYVGLNFKVTKEFAKSFKQAALLEDMKLNEYLRHLFYQAENQKDKKPEIQTSA